MAHAGDLSGFEGHADPAQQEEVAPAPVTPVGPIAGVAPSSQAHALLSLSDELRVPQTLAKAFFTSLQADEDTSVEDFGFCSAQEVEEALDRMTNDAFLPPTAPERAKLRRFHKHASHLANAPYEQVVSPPLAASSSTQAPVLAAPAANLPKKRKFEAVLEQGEEGTFDVISKTEATKVRKTYKTLVGRRPPLNCRPTTDQLSALRARLDEGAAPFADFGIFGPFGRKAAKLNKFEVRKLVGDQVISKFVTGPASHEEWLSSWRVYRAALIMLEAASAGSLDLYEEGIRVLTTLYPNSWSDILLADEEMRFEHWDDMYETLSDGDDGPAPADYDETRPWDFIISQSAFELGVNNLGHAWWQMNLVAALNSPQSTQSVIGRLLGRSSQAAFRGKAQRSPPAHREQTRGKVCDNWNKGQCAVGPCPQGLVHKCSRCGKHNHGATTCGKLVQPSAGKAGGKGKKSRK
jgi:hypothetical protein